MEQWKDIPGYEGIYQASTYGRVRTCKGKTTYTLRHGIRHWKQRTLKPKLAKNKRGRIDPRVNLWKAGDGKTWLVSRLVAITWLEGYSEKMTVNHINGNPLDNHVENLEWVTLSENIAKGYESGLYRATQKPVVLTSAHGTARFDSMESATRYIGRGHGYISNALKKGCRITDANGNLYNIAIKE